MCKRILTHNMHHDVRTPMLLDPFSETAPIYSNPRHTHFHKCELCLVKPEDWPLSCPFPICTLHSCCVLVNTVSYCEEFWTRMRTSLGNADIEEQCEPEQCARFALEHRHVRFPYLGRAYAYPTDPCPATWREDLLEVQGDSQGWMDGVLFAECEMLHRLEEDAKTQFLVYRDLARFWPKGHDQMQVAKFNVEQAQTLLLQQKESVSRTMNWMRGDSSEPYQAFTPIWWMRMWALEQDEYIK
ncbi:uncharacterized protein GGS22DRAFT_90337 [Annulohypoxylon maeteangense]|uniref:uncharacterized protein n=1 Tax=Annulohypoxylon maeteangense TaxID=1927788 RepID=UPI002008AFE3|nr:uncharacterized protein GGS22DRAFT_90337 [Annulohypoxylon maeteangense]KAI0887898.1 hypothetical protein GGS22DRAFT_90337 [Annulohypoxylon maeteangense]